MTFNHNHINHITLIIPPSPFLLDERVFPSLGILKIAAVLERANYIITMLDLSGISNYLDVMVDYLNISDINIFGITTTTPQLPFVVNIANVIKQIKPEAKIILGGPHVTATCVGCKIDNTRSGIGRSYIAMKDLINTFDVLVSGDGEEAIFHALEAPSKSMIDADIMRSPLFLTDEKLDSFPFPARHLIDMDSYHYYIDGERATNLIAQLGCPYNCGFCCLRESPSFRRIRTRSINHIIAELEHIYNKYGLKGFMFYDDELNVNPKMLEMMNAIRNLQVKLGVEFKLRGFIKAQLFTEEQAKAMYEAGFRWILVGFESGSPRILDNINKRSTLEENTRCFEIAKKYRLKVKALMSIGHPGESEETISDTHEWLLEMQPDDFDITIITCYPGSPYYDYALPVENAPGHWVYTYNDDRLFQIEVDYTKVSEYYKGNPDGGYISYVYTDYLNPEDLVYWRDHLERNIRHTLNIPFNPSKSAQLYEHSMGQGIGKYILRKPDVKTI